MPSVKRGAIPSPRSVLAAASPHVARIGAPPNFIVVPQKISMWGNDVNGDCVTAEEAFAKACNNPEIFISDAEVIAWATAHNVLNGAYLPNVMQMMQNDGFVQGGYIYDDGPYFSVNWTNAATLQSAICSGPVKIGVAANQIETAYWKNGGHTGWFGTGFQADSAEDHCVSLCGYGTLAWLAGQLHVAVPAGIDGTKPGYAMFTWDSIGIIDVPSMLAVTHEAWLRQPTSVTKPVVGWHHNDLSAAAGAPAATSCPDGYMFNAQGTQHVNYRGADSHIHELWWNNAGWHHNDLTAAAGGAPAAGFPTAYMFDAQVTQHVDCRGTDNHIHELWWNNAGWHTNDLTAAASGAPAAAGDPAGYMFIAQGTQHVVYRAADNHIHELWWDNTGWHHNDLSAAASAPAAAGNPCGYVFAAQNTEHVDYLGTDKHIHELWWDGAWHHNDLTAAAGAPIAAGNPDGYMFDAQGTQHVNYRGTDNHIHELWWDNSGWHHNDLTTAAGAPLSAGDPAAYMFVAQGTQHVDYRGTDNHIHELWWDSTGWHHNDLSAAASAPAAASDPAGYVFAAQNTQHVDYLGTDQHIHELWWG